MSYLDTRPTPIGDGLGGDDFSPFRVSSARERLLCLRELRDRATVLTVSGPQGRHISATVWTLDPERARLSLDVERQDPQVSELVDGNEATAVAYLDAVKLQFELRELMLVRSERHCALQAALPNVLYRFQRRADYRVRTLPEGAPTAHLRHPALPEMRLALRVLDISLGGCALQLPADVPPLPLGSLVQGAQLALDDQTRLDAALQLQHITATGGPAAALRLGCELHQLSPDGRRALQRWIDQTQKRRRMLALD